MRITGHARLRGIVAACCATPALLTGCTVSVATDPGTGTNPTTAQYTVAPPATTYASTQPPGEVTAPTVNSTAADRLCSDIGAQLSNWRLQGATLGRGGFNLVVQSWAAGAGGINLGVIANRGVIDEITSATCPDVRNQTLELLDIPTLAAGLVGL